MPSASRTVTINRPVADVFAMVVAGANSKQWRPAVLDLEPIAGTGPGVGAEYRQGVKGPGGRRISADYRVTAEEQNRRIAFTAIAGPVRPNGEYTFESVDGNRATRLTFSLDASLGFLKQLFMGGPVQKSMDAEMAALDTLKRLLEA